MSYFAKFVEGTNRFDLKSFTVFAIHLTAGKGNAGGFDLRGSFQVVALEYQFLAVVQAEVRELVDIHRFLLKRIEKEPLDQGAQLTVFFQDVERVVIPTVFTDEVGPLGLFRVGS